MSDENQDVTRAIDEVMAENEALKTKVKSVEAELEKAKNLLKQANDYIANQKRAELMVEVKRDYDVGDEYVSEKTTAELKDMVELAKLARPKIFRSGADAGGRVDSYDEALLRLNTKFKFGKKG